MNKAIIGIFLIGMMILSGCVSQPDASKAMETNKAMEESAKSSSEEAMMGKDETTEETQDAMMEKGAMVQSPYEGTHLGGSHETPYLAFTQSDYEKSISEGKTILLFFYANWCPNCIAEDPKAVSAFNEISNPNIIGFRVNYKDSDTDSNEGALAKQFGVTYQHTKVIVKDGKQIQKALSAWDTEDYLKALEAV
jgi:thiol-disulfide isomerase/thioredoxin